MHLPTTWLITGAGKGIGRALVLELIRRKKQGSLPHVSRVALTARTPNDLEPLAAMLKDAGLEPLALVRDLANPVQAIASVEDTLKKWGTLDVVVNNAGVGRFGDFLELTAEDFDYVSGINLKGTFLLTQNAFAHMKEKRSGHLFFVTSVAAETAFEQSTIYCMSKFGQKGLVEVLRLYGRKYGIRVTNVMPGAVETPMWGPLTPEMKENMMQPEDVAQLIVDAALLPARASVEEIVIRPLKGDL